MRTFTSLSSWKKSTLLAPLLLLGLCATAAADEEADDEAEAETAVRAMLAMDLEFNLNLTDSAGEPGDSPAPPRLVESEPTLVEDGSPFVVGEETSEPGDSV